MFQLGVYPMKNGLRFGMAWADHFSLNQILRVTSATLIEIENEFG
jgi:hypothetical protein